MKQLLKKIIFAGAFIFLIASPVATVAIPQAAHAADNGCEKSLLGIPPWFRGLTSKTNSTCYIVSPNDVGGISPFIWKIALNIIQIGLTITSLIAVFFILYGGFLFLTGGSIASQIEKGRKTVLNAVIGLVISMGAIAVTNLIFGLVSGANLDPTYHIPTIKAEDLLQNALNLAYYIAGIVAVIVIIVAGISYITSGGDSGKVTKAKNMILYAVVGIVVIFIAFAITNFVIGRFQ